MNNNLRLLGTLGVLGLVAWSTPAPIHAAPKTTAPKTSPKAPAAKTPVKPKPTPTRPRPVPRVTPQTTAPIQAPAPTATPLPIPTATPVPPAPTPTPIPPRSRTWALLIGISKYKNPQVSSLRFPATDAAGIRDALSDPQLGGVPQNQIRMLTDEDATASNIMDSVDEFLKPNVKPGDQVVIFLAGHGVAKGVGVDAKSYLLPTDVLGLSSAALERSAVNLRALSDKLGQLPASQFVMFVDACREDPTPGRGIKGNQLSDVMSRSAAIVPQDNQAVSAVTFFACSIGQRAFEDARLKHGVFTYWIIDALREGAVPLKDGSVRMGFLATYVKDKVQQWAETTSKNGDFEVEQTPVAVAEGALTGPIVLMKVKRPVASDPIKPIAPQLTVATFPTGAQVTVNGKPAGAGDITIPLDGAGDVTIRVEAPGYEPISRSIKVREGYAFQVPVQLQPGARGVGNPAMDMTSQMFQRATEAEARQQWEVAIAGYSTIIQADPKFQPAYVRLANLQRRQGDLPKSIATLIELVNKTTPDAHSYSLLAGAYVKFWERALARETGKKENRRSTPGRGFSVPTTATEAAILARRAADEAVRLGPTSAEAQRALGLALIAGDDKGKNKRDALTAFGKAVFADDKDAANHYGLGYGIRFFAAQDKEGAARTAELKRAVATLKEAVALRPEYFEAHRELAYTYYLLDDNEAALRECEIANACRGDAADPDEVAGINVAMAGIHKKEAQQSQGEKKQQHEAASAGYMGDAKETSPDLTVALGFLRGAGLSTRLSSYLPPEFNRVMNFDPKAEIRNQLPSLPGGIRIPGF